MSISEWKNVIFRKLLHLYCSTGIAQLPHGSLRYFIHKKLRKIYIPVKLKYGVRSQYPFWSQLEHENIFAPCNSNRLDCQLNLTPGQKIRFDLREALLKTKAKGIALVFFMGMGDYLFTTPLLAELRRQFPNVHLHAYISNSVDSTNSPFVGKLIAHDPNIDQVVYYNGKRSVKQKYDWRNYDYTDALKQAPKDFLIVPVVYDNYAETRHRVFALFDAFNLPRPPQPLPPILHMPAKVPNHVRELALQITKCLANGLKGIVGLQLEARSSFYTYPYAEQLAERFSNLDFLVLSFSPLQNKYANAICVDLNKFSIVDSIHLLILLQKEHQDKLKLLTITSVFGSVSAALGIKNMQMWHFEDNALHTLWYPNIHIITYRDYPALPVNSITVFRENDRLKTARGQFHYLPDRLVEVFLKTYYS